MKCHPAKENSYPVLYGEKSPPTQWLRDDANGALYREEALATSTGVTRASDQLTLRLPAPTGHHRVETTALHLVGPARRDPWNGAPQRELMLSVFYPAGDVRGRQVAPQMTPRAAESFKAFAPLVHPQLPTYGVAWEPVILYTPGGAGARTLGTGTAEELASNGFVVVTIDHDHRPLRRTRRSSRKPCGR
jgi:predicted dienelactone hydrolase